MPKKLRKDFKVTMKYKEDEYYDEKIWKAMKLLLDCYLEIDEENKKKKK